MSQNRDVLRILKALAVSNMQNQENGYRRHSPVDRGKKLAQLEVKYYGAFHTNSSSPGTPCNISPPPKFPIWVG